ncbi:MAG TPA: type II CAAX endopeptidase family protein [Pyrinomonadaceae bacterium]|nr:type II CAAX endopeptidase family protein [Pyrinomonadaceae bacterium]
MRREEIPIPVRRTAIANKRRVLFYFALAYLISWLLWMPLVASSQNWIYAGAPFILFYLGTVGPALAAVILLRLDHGKGGVWSLLRKLVLWRVGVKWYLFALFLPAAIRFTALSLLYLFGYIASDFSFRPWHELLGISLLMLVLVPFEEIGWRGYALPRLQAMYGALWASVILGILWSLWHLPLLWVKGAYQESHSPLTYILVFTVTILPISILFTWLYNHTKGSLLLASLFHAAINITESALIIRDKDGVLLLLVACTLNSALAAILIVRLARSSNV